MKCHLNDWATNLVSSWRINRRSTRIMNLFKHPNQSYIMVDEVGERYISGDSELYIQQIPNTGVSYPTPFKKEIL